MLWRREADVNTEQKKNIWNRRTPDQTSRFQRRCSFFASVPRSVFFSSPRSMHVFCFVFALFKWINSFEQCSPAFFELYPPFFMSSRVTCLGKWPSRTSLLFFFEKIKKEKEIYFLEYLFYKSEFFLCCKKNIYQSRI